jgi:hypothetical protein
MHRQKGLGLLGLLLTSCVVIAIALLGMKVAPSFIEYFTIVRHIKQVSTGSDTSSVAAVRRAYDLRTSIEETPSVAGADLEISKQGSDVVISFAYAKKIPLFGNVSLCIDFAGSTAGGKRASAF